MSGFWGPIRLGRKGYDVSSQMVPMWFVTLKDDDLDIQIAGIIHRPKR